MKQIIAERLKHSRIAIYGVDEHTPKYVNELKTLFTDIIHLTDFTEEFELQPFSTQDIKTIMFDDYCLNEDTYIIITGQFVRSQNKLILLKLREYIDYASIHIIRAIIRKKNLVTIMGNGGLCQLTAALRSCSGFYKKYHIKYYNGKTLYRGPRRVQTFLEYKHVTRVSDIYIYNVYSDNTYWKNIIDKEIMCSECKRISVSGNKFNGLYPQIRNVNRLNGSCFREETISEIPYTYFAFSLYDFVMESFISRDFTERGIIRKLMDPWLFTGRQIQYNFDNSINLLKKSDDLADIKLADEIYKNKNEIIVSHSLEEWHPKIIKYILNQIFEIIGHIEYEYDDEIIEEAIYTWSGNEIPVYPCILDHFNLNNKYKNKL